MSDIEHVVKAVETHGVGVGGFVAAGYVAQRLFVPSLDAIGARLKETTVKRLENLRKIGDKVDRLIAESDAYPHVRVVQRILNDATLYDDDVQQTYVAGLLAGSRNSDGSDDRPVFFLTLIDGLTASQLRAFHVLYSAVALDFEGVTGNQGPTTQSITIPISEYLTNLTRLEPSSAEDYEATLDLLALEHVGLIAHMSIQYHSDDEGEINFWGTRIGGVLFDWAHGLDEDFRNFGLRKRPNIGLPEMIFAR